MTYPVTMMAQSNVTVPIRLLVAFVAAFAFGGLVEGIQLFVPDREARLSDVVLNGIGALVGCLAAYGLMPKHIPA